MFSFIYRATRVIRRYLHIWTTNFIAKITLKGNKVKYGVNLTSYGIPIVNVHTTGKCIIGDNFTMNNGFEYNPIGRNQPCYLIVRENAVLTIGNNVGMSSTAIIVHCSVKIGNDVKIGGNCVIYDTDFHSINFSFRREVALDIANAKEKAVVIDDDVFIGGHVTILKGVTIGKGAVIGSGAVVTRDVPPMEIWAGNPARFVKAVS